VKRDLTELLGVTNELLRSPARIAERCREDSDLRPLVVASMLAIAVGGALFGAALGAPKGALQATYAAIKLPLAMLAALVVCTPAFHVLNAGLAAPQPLRSIVALTLAATARAALVLLACTPGLWLTMDSLFGYHQSVLAASGCYLLAGTAAVGVLVRGLTPGPKGLVVAFAFLCVLFPVGGQTAWMLRPFLGRPAQQQVPFLRARESSFADAVMTSAWSAVGIYRRIEDDALDIESDVTGRTRRSPAHSFSESTPVVEGFEEQIAPEGWSDATR